MTTQPKSNVSKELRELADDWASNLGAGNYPAARDIKRLMDGVSNVFDPENEQNKGLKEITCWNRGAQFQARPDIFEASELARIEQLERNQAELARRINQRLSNTKD